MSPDNRDAEDELEVSDLRSGAVQPHVRAANGPRREAALRRRVALGISLALLLVAFVGALPATRDTLGQLATRLATPTPTAHALPSPTQARSSGPTPTAFPGVTGIPTLDSAPTGCGDNSVPPLRGADPPSMGEAVGQAPVWVSGFEGSYPTLRVKTVASANGDASPYGWPLQYTQYGWPVAIDLMLGPEMQGPVTLTGWNPDDLHPLWFGFVTIPTDTPPAEITTAFTLDRQHPSVPEGGASAESGFWYGYIFVPEAGCYILSASWPNGEWKFLVSAGR